MIIDYNGGTYCLQAEGDSRHQAALNCLEQWDISQIMDAVSSQLKEGLIKELIKAKSEGDDFMALTGLLNIWSHYLIIDHGTVLMNLILTQPETS